MSKVQNITPSLFWLGALDPHLRVFDIIMETQFGTTYNAYLLKGKEGVVLFETVKERFFEEYLENIKSLTALEDITYIVVNHTEPDHAGSVAKLLDYAPQATVVGSGLAIKYMAAIANKPFKSKVVKEGDQISLGDKTLRFLSVPCLHWPDTMYTYIEEEQVLVTCDSFGEHYCDERLFKSKLEPEKEGMFKEAYRYYFDMIMGPFKPYVQKALAKIKDLPLQYICPGHGMILEESNMKEYIDLYDEWSKAQEITHPTVIIPYVSAYGYTAEIAQTLAKGLKEANSDLEIKLYDLVESDINEVAGAIHNAQGLLVGSPTLLADALPPIWQLLGLLNPILDRKLVAGCFGAYGWSGEALPHMQERLKQLKCQVPLEPLGVVFKPSEADLMKATTFAKEFANSIK
ncbi:FprA family A-type flavoprotein [Sporanaerobium hydrogeniformans]|uniref:FprA family A-type flavoprotein n=1 Tax=Sporanaerobium hydrogeniformans TaxID=3072179 RepID=A0AC61DDL4_9FIRM|nr:FprA family A-type flavoprotein [Sporanaerobium hydrogeniformans]PHV70732.1 FprA family A-type flavoprotein [Sporanaerobium hydrogeniformans]